MDYRTETNYLRSPMPVGFVVLADTTGTTAVWFSLYLQVLCRSRFAILLYVRMSDGHR